MITEIQGYKFNFYKNEKNAFTLKNIVIYIFLYIPSLYFLYYYIIRPHKSILEGFIFVSFIYMVCDFGGMFSLFDKAVHHLPALLYDTLIVGGGCMALTQYMLYHYYDILKRYRPILLIGYFCTMFYFFYAAYKYNPDLSNLKGVVLF
jgi:hypothetical protein